MSKKLAIATLLVLALSLLVFGCAANKTDGKSQKKKAQQKQKEEIIRDARADMLDISKVKNNPDAFSRALAGKALEDFTKQYNNDLAAGKVKIRRYDNIEFKYTDISKEFLARVEVSFDDSSYFVSAGDLNNQLDFPQSEAKKLMLHLLKSGKRWKIVAIAKSP